MVSRSLSLPSHLMIGDELYTSDQCPTLSALLELSGNRRVGKLLNHRDLASPSNLVSIDFNLQMPTRIRPNDAPFARDLSRYPLIHKYAPCTRLKNMSWSYRVDI